MFIFIEKAIVAIAMLRLISGSIEVFAALLILKLNDIKKTLIVNSSLALIGPIILIVTTTIGFLGISDKMNVTKFLWIFGGVACILYGVKSNEQLN
jgi:hypothetical protein